MKKIIVWVFAVVMGQMVAASDVDLYRGLLFWIKSQNNIEGNELRKTTYPLSQVFDGSFYNQLAGTAIPQRDNQDYTFSLSFKVGERNCVNRLLMIGGHSIYLDTDNKLYYHTLSTAFIVDATNKYYSLVFRVDENHRLTIYAGVKDQRLSQVMSSGISGYLNFSSAVGMSSLKLGYGSKPSTGNLQSGQFANIRFWTRALSDEECAMVDKSQNVAMSADDIPVGAPKGSIWDFFPLDGNAYRTASTNMVAVSQNTVLENWTDSADRFGMGNRAVMSVGNGKVTISAFETLFKGAYTLNNGTALGDGSQYWGGQYSYVRGNFYYPYPAAAVSNTEKEASYSVWVRVEELPENGSVLIFDRTVDNTDGSSKSVEPQTTNKSLTLSLSSTGNLILAGSGMSSTTFNNHMSVHDWHMITIVGKANSVLVYLDGKEIGNVASTMTLGYLPPIDKRRFCIQNTTTAFITSGGVCYYYLDRTGTVQPCAIFTLGGWNGSADGLAFFHSALTAAQVRELYEVGRHPDPNTTITPTTRNFPTGGGGGAIITSGSASTWWARVTEPWITLSSNSGNIGYPVAYTVSATTNAEQRVGYVYVNGHAHQVTQDGLGGTISSDGATYEKAGGSGTIALSVQNGIAWKAISNVDWLSVSPTNGIGSGSVTYQVAAYNEVATRQGTLTIAGNTFTVFQYGRRIKLEPAIVTQNYETHVIPITVNALAITQWSVTPNNSWISVVDAGNGQGGDLVTIAIAENPSYKARTGTVKIGTETFTVTQQGRPTAALSFSVSPTASTASVDGANGTIAVTATPDLPWTATSGANWLTVYAATATGTGNGNVVYSASPNPTLSQRTGNITITPESTSGMAAKTHKVTQPAATSALSMSGYEFEASGESCSVEVSVASIVQWSISESLDWITVNGSTSRTGPGTVTLQAAANNTVYPRSGTVKIADKNFSVSQKARGVELEYDTKLFGTDGGYESISIHPDGNVSWTAVASDATWITIFQGDSGTGDGEILYIVSPYVGDGTARTGWITVGSQKVYITQRAYDLNIEPNGTNVVGNAGAGEFGVSASINDVWTAIVTEPWITIVSGYDSGTGSGTVRFLYTENNTGKTRTGKIIVAGEVYTLTQRARQMVSITATAEHGGHVSGGGSYDLGTEVTLTAVPDSGYAFSYWTGAVSTMQNPLTVTADVAKSYTAVFEPLPIAFTSVVSDTNGVSLAWNNLAWAGTYRIYRGITSVPSSATVLVELPNNGNCTYLDTTGDVDVEYWYWIEAEGPSDEVMSDPMTGHKEKPIIISPIMYENLRGAANPNPSTYREGTLVSFQNPGALTGYTFAGWTPSQITADMTGAQTVQASWTANGYSIAYNPNGGSGTMEATAATYDSESTIAANGFAWTGHVFTGWATNVTGEVIYAAGQHVTNLTAQSSGVVTLYAVWEPLVVAPPQIFPADGSDFTDNTCEVMILCETEGASIYYSPNGTTPRLTDAYLYTGPFTIADTATIKAIAVLDGVRSEYVTATITKRVLSLGEAVSADASGAALTWTTGGDAQWTAISDATTSSGYSVQSGTIGDATGVDFSTTWLQTEVSGVGTVSFRWKVDCEWDDSGDMTWDHVAFYTNGVEAARMDGTSDWEDLSFTFADAGTHTLRWTFMKDDYNEETFPDHAWVSGFMWTPTPDPIPEIGGDADVAGALMGSADGRLSEYIKTAAEYNAYRGWVDAKGLDHQAAKNSPRAWFSYVTGADGLVEQTFQNGDVVIDSLAPVSGGTIMFEVDVKDVLIGSTAMAENLATVFEVQGSTSLNAGTFSSDNVTASFGVSASGRLVVTAYPIVAHETFFVRVIMHADSDETGGESGGGSVSSTVNVTFDANGGSGAMTVTKTHGVALGTLPTPTRDGYAFDGWFTAANGGTQVSASTVVTADVTYFAHWTENTGGNGGSAQGLYCVIDLSAGTNAVSYPVSYMAAEPSGGFNTDEYKTTKLVLRMIEPGSFMMSGQYDVTLTKAYYMGVFEVTQRQYELVMGSNPSSYVGDKRPVENVSWNVIRGDSDTYDWPTRRDVDPASFMGRISARTGLAFDLPTEAQWEYACRAGTTSDYNNGGNTESDMATLGRYNGNVSDGKGGYFSNETTVGSYMSNDWGLWDMHGNVQEWCKDWYVDNLSSGGTDPEGPISGTYRVRCGGSWNNAASDCVSSSRVKRLPRQGSTDIGFRIARTLSDVTIVFDANGGNGGMTVEKAHGAALGTLPTPTRDGYAFDGWFTAADGGTQVSASTVVMADVTYFAHWTENTGGNGGSTQGLYCIVDLSAGTNAVSYPVSYMAAEPSGGFNTDEYKTTKLVLRMIEPGSFMMSGQYDVTLTKAYYMGVFEVTQRQYELVMGSNPAQYKGDMRPVEKVSYDMIRGSSNGASWPSSSDVDSTSFMGKLRARTGLAFDLPTESQWEYACRAGTTSDYNNGGSTTNDLNVLGRYQDNQSDGSGGYSAKHTSVGSYLANAWGLYDMHGNVWEWCLDWSGGTLSGGNDPEGPSTGGSRRLRGGSWYVIANNCTSASATGSTPSLQHNHVGFRIARTLSETTAVVTHNKVQLWENGPYWAETNIGAAEPWESGYYFWWGGHGRLQARERFLGGERRIFIKLFIQRRECTVLRQRQLRA